MAESMLGNVIGFLGKIGVFDVVLPFLLVFSLVFAILEKTKVLGEETHKDAKGKQYKTTRKAQNSMIAFVISFFVIASSQLVGIITTVSSQMVVLLFLGVFFLLLIGSFYEQGEVGTKGLEKLKTVQKIFLWLMFAGIIAIFLHAIKLDSGDSWLEFILFYIRDNWSSTAVASIILIALMIWFVAWMAGEPKPQNDGDDK